LNTVNDVIAGLNDLERQQLSKLLKELNKGNTNVITELIQDIWDEIPVDIDTFIDDPRYLRNCFYPDGATSCIIYPYWREKLKEIFKDPYKFSEIAFSGGIGLGKSEIAKLALAYLSYRLLCLKNPQLFYNKPMTKPIVILFFNNTKELAEKVLLRPFVEMVMQSPWFMENGKITGREHLNYIPHKNVRFEAGSRSSHALGQDIFAGIIDEINFAQGADVSIEKSKIMGVYAAINTRISNRFRVEGNVHGKLFLVSSKRSEYDFLEQYVQKMKSEDNFYLVDDKVWNIVPPEKTGYSGKTFKLAIGGNILPSKIIQEHEDIDALIKQGYEILEVPIEEKQKFELDMERNLMDIAAVSITYTTKFLNYEIISQCYTEDQNPFINEIISLGTKDDLEVKDFFKLNDVIPDIRRKPGFIHIDTSLTGDRTGIGYTCMIGRQKTETFDVAANKVIKTYKTVYKHVFNIEIQCPKDAEISFQKTRNFIAYLRQSGFNICAITTDGYQSADTRQMLELMGFEDVKRVKFEQTPEIYMSLRNALIEKRISLLKIKCLEKQLLLVERNNQSGKIGHPENNGDGHGDGADGLAGSLYNAIVHEAEYSDALTTIHLISPADTSLEQENILKAAAGIINIEKEISQKPIQSNININQPQSENITKKQGLSSWIL